MRKDNAAITAFPAPTAGPRRSTAGGGLAAEHRSLDDTRSISLEQMLGALPVDCHFNTRTGFSFRKANPDGTATYTHAYCNMMTCRTCAKKRCLSAAGAIKDAITGHGMRAHVTLTLPPNIKDHEQGRALARAIRRLLLNIADGVQHPFSYVWAYGCGKGGRLHLHLVTNAVRVSGTHAVAGKGAVAGADWRVSKSWVRKRWLKLTGARQARVSAFPPKDAGWMSRYLMKNVLETVFAGCDLKRRFGSSRDISLIKRCPKAPCDGDGGKWERVSGPSSRHGRRLGVYGVGHDLNPTFIAPATDTPPCQGTGEDGTVAQGGDDPPPTATAEADESPSPGRLSADNPNTGVQQ